MPAIHMLGPVEVRDAAGQVLEELLRQPKRVALLAYLAAAEPRGFHRRETLLGLFWPESPSRQARLALSQALRFLRQHLGSEALVTRGEGEVALDDAVVSCDVWALRDAVAQGDHAQALALYQGELLSGFSARASAEWEHWLDGARARVQRAYAAALEQLALEADAAGDATRAVALWRQLAEVDPCATRVTVRLIAALEQAGDRAEALRVADDHRQRLKAELDAEPSPEVEAIARRLREQPTPSTTSLSTRERLARAVAGRYRVGRAIGAGGMALVYLADDLKLGRPVAIKVLRPELAAAIGHERFLNEIDIAARLAHPNVLPLHDFGQADGLVYYVMPYVEGPSLRERLAREGTLSLEEALRITREVADALAHAHAQGIVHRDIKPANILLLADHAVVSDFGVARAVGAAVEDQALVATTGTPAYMSPEQAAGSADVDARSDLYSLGCVLYEMLVGAPPHTTGATDHSLPHTLEKPLRRALATVPQARYATAQEFAGALDVGPPRDNPVRRRSPLAWKAAIALAAVAVIASGTYGTVRYRAATGWRRADLDSGVVVVMPFRITATDPVVRNLGEGVIDFLYPILSAEVGLRAVEPGPFLVKLREEQAAGDVSASELPIRLAAHFGAARVLEGSIAQAGRQLTLNAWLRRVPDGSTLDQRAVTGTIDSSYALILQLAVSVLGGQLDEPDRRFSVIAGRPLPAIREYLAGAHSVRAGRHREALEHFRQAVAVDSTFALAALRAAQLWQVHFGTTVPIQDLRVAQDYAASFSDRDRAALQAMAAHREVSAVIVAAARAWVEQAPDDPRAWLELAYYTAGVGRLLAIPDWEAQARSAFERAWQLDSTTPDLVGLHVRDAIFAEQRGWLRRVAQRYDAVADTTADHWLFNRWGIAEAQGDSGGIQGLQARLLAGDDRGEGWAILRQWASRLMPPSMRDSVVRVLLARPMSPVDSTAMMHHVQFYALETGRLHEVLELYDRLRGSVRGMRDSTGRRGMMVPWMLIYPGLDSAIGAFIPALSRVPSTDDGYYDAACNVLLYRAAGGDTTGVRAAVRRLMVPQVYLGLCPAMVEAFVESYEAHRRDSPALDELERRLRQGPFREYPAHVGMAVLARLRRARGQYEEALAAARARFPVWAVYRHQRVPMLKQEGDLAAILGDTAGAIQAYTEYLSFRVDPDPGPMQSEVDSVRAALAALQRQWRQ